MQAEREKAAARVYPRRPPLPGRARLVVVGLKHDPALAARLETRLPRRPEIAAAEASPKTGNLLVHFDDALPFDDLLALVVAELDADRTDIRSPDEGDPPAQAERRNPYDSVAPGGGGTEEEPLWHCIGAEDVADRLQVTADGLSPDEAQARLGRYGANSLAESGERSVWQRVGDQLLSLPVGLLVVSAALSVATGGILDAVVILSVVGLNAGIGYFTEAEASRTISALTRAGPAKALVTRGGTIRSIPVDEIVPGDRLRLGIGTLIGADGRVTASDSLLVNEASLTGESEPVPKVTDTLEDPDLPLADRANMVWRGTAVIGGEGEAVAVATGRQTEIGRIQSMVGEAGAPDTPMQRELDRAGRQLVWLSLGICGLVFGVGMLRGFGLLPMLQSSISLAIAAVPEGLPTIATSTLAIGVRDIRRQGVLVRKLDAVETLGSVTVVCLDKTGTLTENRMTEVAIAVGTGDPEELEDRADTDGDLLAMQEAAALCSEITPEAGGSEDGEDGVAAVSPTEQAVIDGARCCGADPAGLARHWPLVDITRRTPSRNYMTMLRRDPEDRLVLAVKGNPSEVLALCSSVREGGRDRPLDDADREAIERGNARLTGRALRVLGVASARPADAETADEAPLIWHGLVGLADPLRPGMRQLIEALHRAGLRTVMITGDQAATAEAIARELDLSDGAPVQVLESAYLERMEPEALSGLAQQAHVFARVSPAHKLSIVRSLQSKGAVVAMTGDGINDSPALKAADVGTALGKSGTDVARDVADIVLEDDELATLVEAIARGRTTYSNVRKAIRFLLATNLSEIMVTLVATSAGIRQPLTPMQLLWINLVTDVLPAIGLALEPPEPDVLDRPPRGKDEPFLRAADFRSLGREAGIISAGAMTAGLWGLSRYGAGPQARTVLSNSLLAGQLPHALISRSDHVGLFSKEKLPSNRALDGFLVASAALQLAAVLVPPLRRLLGQAPLGAVDYGVVAATGGAAYLINEGWKAAARPPAAPASQEEPEP